MNFQLLSEARMAPGSLAVKDKSFGRALRALDCARSGAEPGTAQKLKIGEEFLPLSGSATTIGSCCRLRAERISL
jgi:hypothetical protein